MKKTFLKISGAILLAVVACLTVLVALVFLSHTLTLYAVPPSDILPADYTHGIFVHIQDEDKPLIESLLPENTTLPHSDIAALLKIEDHYEWIEFYATPQEAEMERVGRWYVAYSNPIVKNYLGPEYVKIRHQDSFQALRKEFDSESRWAYFSEKIPRRTHHLFEHVLLGGAGELRISYEPYKIVMSRFGAHSPIESVLENNTIRRTFLKSALSLTTEDLHDDVTYIESVTPLGEAVILRSLLEKEILNTFGTSISLTYDLLPLFKNRTHVELGKNGSGQTLLAFSSTHENPEKIVNKLIDLSLSAESSGEVVRRNLSDRDLSIDIRKREKTVNDMQEINGWSVYKSNRFSAAFKDTQFILANNSKALDSYMSPTKSQKILPFRETIEAHTLRGGGSIDSTTLGAMFANSPYAPFSALPRNITPAPDFVWTVVDEGSIQSVVLHY